MSRFKRKLSIFLALILIVAAVPLVMPTAMTASANSGGNGDYVSSSVGSFEWEPITGSDITPAASFYISMSSSGAYVDGSGYIVFPDDNFRDALYALGIGTPSVGITPAEAVAVTHLDISSSNISDIAGIEFFTDLQYLDCSNNDLIELHMSNFPSLEELYCNANRIYEFTISNMNSLRILDCSNNRIVELRLSNLPALEELYCNRNVLRSFSISGTQLRILDVSDNLLSGNVTLNMAALEVLICHSNLLGGLDLRNAPNITTLICYGNDFRSESSILGLSSLNLSTCTFSPQNAPDETITVVLPESPIRHVPYSQFIFNMADGIRDGTYSNTLFGSSGTRPPGLGWYSTPGLIAANPDVGNVYLEGVPTTPGTYTFTLHFVGLNETTRVRNLVDYTFNVTVAATYPGFEYADDGYEIIQKIPDMLTTDIANRDFIIEGFHMAELEAVYINGVQLIRNTQYTVREGSTIITILAQTFQTFGTGTHTLAAEFRPGGGELKVAAQSFTVSSVGGNDSSDDSYRHSISQTTTTSATIQQQVQQSVVTMLERMIFRLIGADFVSLADLRELARRAAAEGKTPWLNVDTMVGNAVDIRVGINPALATTNMNLAGSTTSQSAVQTKSLFERFFANDFAAVLGLTQKDNFGQAARICVRIAPDTNIANLAFYSYNPETNTYQRIQNVNPWLDANGYLHFSSTLANNIIISNGVLEIR